jgi:hypothetical protein
MKRYGYSVMELDITLGIRLIRKAYEKQTDSMLWDMWLVKYSWMDEDNFISFNDFKEAILKQNEISNSPAKTRDEIITQSEEIIKAWKG